MLTLEKVISIVHSQKETDSRLRKWQVHKSMDSKQKKFTAMQSFIGWWGIYRPKKSVKQAGQERNDTSVITAGQNDISLTAVHMDRTIVRIAKR